MNLSSVHTQPFLSIVLLFLRKITIIYTNNKKSVGNKHKNTTTKHQKYAFQNCLPKALMTFCFNFDHLLGHTPVNRIIHGPRKHTKVAAPKPLFYVII